MSGPLPQQSPLVRVKKTELKPKVLKLYEELFQTPNPNDKHAHTEGYWTEFFLLRCNKQALASTLVSLSPEKMLQQSKTTQELFLHAIESLGDSSDYLVDNTLHILSVFFPAVFSKPFVSYSSDLISVITGLDSVDRVFIKFLDAISKIISTSPHLYIRVSAIRTITIVAGGSYSTSLASCFLYRDLFAAIIDFVNFPDSKLYIGDAFSLIGILASFDKLEGENPYQLRLADFVDNSSMQAIVNATGHAWHMCLDRYIAEIDPTSKSSFNLESIVYWMGGTVSSAVRSSSSSSSPSGSTTTAPVGTTTAIATANSPSTALAYLPHPAISLLLANYEFINANKVFARKFIESKGEPTQSQIASGTKNSAPVVLFLSTCSYLFQDQSRGPRVASYTRLAMFVIRGMLEDTSGTVGKLLLTTKTNQLQLDNHRTPALTHLSSERSLLSGVLDVLQQCLRFNLRRSLDFEMYTFGLETLFQALILLKNFKTRFHYIWKDLWKTLMSLVKFLNSHPPSSDTSSNSGTSSINTITAASKCAESTALVISCCLVHGDSFLYTDDEYDDLYYTVVENAQELNKFRDTYKLQESTAMAIIDEVCTHFLKLLEEKQKKNAANAASSIFSYFTSTSASTLSAASSSKSVLDSLSTAEVLQVIKEGYSSISLYKHVKNNELLTVGLPRFREEDERLFLKRMTKIVINDVTSLYI